MITILLVEDDPLFRDALATAIGEHGYRVVQAANGEEAVKRFCAERADLVLTDLVMPKREGIETIGDLRRLAPRLGIIAMSGGVSHRPDSYLKIAGKLGANRTLKKPFTLPVLFQTIEDVLNECANQAESDQKKTAPTGGYSPDRKTRSPRGASPG